MLYVVGSTNWKRVKRTLIISYAKRIVQALNDHAEEWRLTPDQLIMSIVERDGYSTDGSVPRTTTNQYPSVEMRQTDVWRTPVVMPKMELMRIAKMALDVWLMNDADNECFRIRNLVCGTVAWQEQQAKPLPANALHKLLMECPGTPISPRTPQWKRVRSSVIVTNKQRILDWLIAHQQTWRDPFDPQMTESIIY
jgi:hypothetical protein